MHRAVVIMVHRRLTKKRRATWSITTNQRNRSLVALRNVQLASQHNQTLQLSSLDLRINYFRFASMTSQNVGDVCDSMKNGCTLGLPLFDGKRFSDSCQVQGSSHPVVSHEFSPRTTATSSALNLSERSTSFSCTPHSIDDILSRPRRVHPNSLLLPVSGRSSGLVTQGRLCSWSMRSSEEVQRLVHRTGDDDLTWKSFCWSQHSPATQAQFTGTAPTKRGMSW